ncbi:MAG: hypothetical protein COB98_03910 [Flavobacteriaceae bacterium]|nr:MAG: hypothetical protein COB98_03910 [Flavobacteriaceae bacterium]
MIQESGLDTRFIFEKPMEVMTFLSSIPVIFVCFLEKQKMNIQDKNTLMVCCCTPFLLWTPAFARMTDARVSIVVYITSSGFPKTPEYIW